MKTKEKLSPKQQKEYRQLCTDIAMMKARCGQLGFYKTMHAMEHSVNECGWELAEKLGGNPKHEEEYKKVRAKAGF